MLSVVPLCHTAGRGDAPRLAAVARLIELTFNGVSARGSLRRTPWAGAVTGPRSSRLVHMACPPLADTRPALPGGEPPPTFSGHVQATQHLTCLVLHEAGPTQPPGVRRGEGKGEMCPSPSPRAEPLSPLPAPSRSALVWKSPLQGLTLEAIAKHLLWFHRAPEALAAGAVQPPSAAWPVPRAPGPAARASFGLASHFSLLCVQSGSPPAPTATSSGTLMTPRWWRTAGRNSTH